MFEAQVAYYLNRYLGTYLYGLDPQSLKISVFKGDVVLHNLQLKPEALNSLNLPIVVKAGLLGSLKLKVPWTNLGRAPVIVEMDRLYILAGPRKDSEEAATDGEVDVEKAEAEAKRKRVADMELSWVHSREATEDGKPGRFRAIADTVLGNLQLSITNVHVRYEDDQSNSKAPFACGLTLQKLSAHTVDEFGREAFVTQNPMDLLRKAAQLCRFALYFDVDAKLWDPEKPWDQLKPEEWDQLFLGGITGASEKANKGSSGEQAAAEVHTYLLRPVDGQTMYLRRGRNVRSSESEAVQEADVQLNSVSLHLSRAQYLNLQKLLNNFSAYSAQSPNRHIRPHARPKQGASARSWWRYAVAAVTRQLQSHRLSWPQLQNVFRLRKLYVPHYVRCLMNDQMGGDETIERMDEELTEPAILSFRRLAHAKVARERKRQAAAAAKERRAAQAGGWLGWLRGTSAKKLDTKGQEEEPLDEDEDADMRKDLSPEEVAKLEELVHEQENAVQTDAQSPNSLQLNVTLHVGSGAAVLDGAPGAPSVVRGGLEGISCTLKKYPVSTAVQLAVQAVGIVAPEGTLLRTGADLRRLVSTTNLPGLDAEAESAISEAAPQQALDVMFVSKPQDGSADAVLHLTLSPSYVTYNAATIDRIHKFFQTDEVVDLSALGAQAVAQVERARQAAADQLAAAIKQKPKLALRLQLDAPKVALPVPATADGQGKLTLVLDFGRFVLESDRELAEKLPPEEAALYECLRLQMRDISAYLVDGDFSFTALEARGAYAAIKDAAQQQEVLSEEGQPAEAAIGASALSKAIESAVDESEAKGAAHGGTAVFIPLLERCGADAALQAGRFPHPRLPPLRLQLQVPRLRFFFSPARVRRVMRVVHGIMPAHGPEDASSAAAAPAGQPPWRTQAEFSRPVRVLEWGGVARTLAQWPQRQAYLYRGQLYLLDSDQASEPTQTHNIWIGRRVVHVPPEACGGVQHVIAVVPDTTETSKALEDSNSLLLRFNTQDEAEECLRMLIRSQQSVQELAGRSDAGGAALDDWEDSTSVASSEPVEDASRSAGPAAPAARPEVSLNLTADLGELALFVSGRVSEVWWPPEVVSPESSEAALVPVSLQSTGAQSDTVNVDGEQSLVVVRASSGSANVMMGPSHLGAGVAIGAFEIEDLLVGPKCPACRHLARSFQEAEPASDSERFYDADSEMSRAGSLRSAASSVAGRRVDSLRGDASRKDSVGSAGSDSVFLDADETPGGSGQPLSEQAVRSLQKQAWTLDFETWKPTSPLYASIDSQLHMRLTTLFFFCNRPTIGALMAVGVDLGKAFKGDDAEDSQADSKSIASTDATLASSATLADEDINEAGKLQLGGGSERVVFRLIVEMEKLEAVFNYEGRAEDALALASIDDVRFNLNIHPATLLLTASLGNVRLQDGAMPVGHRYRDVIDLRRGATASLIELEFASHTAEESMMDPRVPNGAEFYTLNAQLQELDIVDLGSLQLCNRINWVGGEGVKDPKAVLLEQDVLTLKELSATVTANGKRGDNLIRDYDAGITVRLQRPLRDVLQSVPAMEVAIDIPSIKATVSDQEYQLITSMAGDNLAEPVKVPKSAQWLQQYYQRAEAEEQGQEASLDASLDIDGSHALDSASGALTPQPSGSSSRRGSLASGSLRTPIARSSFQSRADSGAAGGAAGTAQRGAASQAAKQGQRSERSRVRVIVTLGKAELELLRTVNQASGTLGPLARFSVGTLWLCYRQTQGGATHLALSLPRVEAVDLRPWVPQEHSLVISSAPIAAAAQSQGTSSSASTKVDTDRKPSFLMLEYHAEPGMTQQKLKMRLQRPTVVAEVGFMLAVTKFVVPKVALSGITPIPFQTHDLLLKESVCEARGDFYLSPESRLLADAPDLEDYVYDGKGSRLILPDGIGMEAPLPLIIVGAGKTLILRNVKIVYAASLPACLQLGPGAQLVAHPGDNVQKCEGADPDTQKQALDQSHPTTTLQMSSLSRASRTISYGAPKANALGQTQPQDATPLLDLRSMEIDVVAVGMGLRFVELDDTDLEADVLKPGPSRDLDKRSGEQAPEGPRAVRMLAAYLDLEACYKIEGDFQKAYAELRGFRIETQINLNPRAGPHGLSEGEQAGAGRVQGVVLEPCKVSVDMKLLDSTGDFKLSISDLRLNLSADILELVLSLQKSVVEPLVQPSADRPIAKCTTFVKLWSNSSAQSGSPVDTSVLGEERGLTFWRPQAPIGYAILGDCMTSGKKQPTFQVLAVAVNSGLVAYPVSYISLWSVPGLSLWWPQPPKGYASLGCLVTAGPEPPSLTDAVCIHSSVGVEAPLGQCLTVRPEDWRRGLRPTRTTGDLGHIAADQPGAVNVWCVENAAATIAVCSSEQGSPDGPFLDLRSPLGVTPAALSAAAKTKAAAPTPAAARLPSISEPLLSPRSQANKDSLDRYQEYDATRKQLLRSQSARQLRSTTCDFRRMWWDKGMRNASGKGASIWRPVPPPGYVALGDCLEPSYDPPLSVVVLRDVELLGDPADQAASIPLLRSPRGYEMVWTDEAMREDKALTLWKPVPHPGYVAIGCVATLGRNRPSRTIVRCVRADGVSRADITAMNPVWRLPSYKARKALAVMIADERLGTFMAYPVGSMPQPEDLWHLRLLDQDEAQGPSEQAQQAGGGLNVVIKTGATSILVRDALRRPLLELELSAIEAGLRRLSSSAMQAYMGFTTSLWSYNATITAWEPVIEPWDLIVKADTNTTSSPAFGISPGTHITMKSTSETVYITLAYAAINSCLGAVVEWRALHGPQGGEAYKRQLAAADASAVHTLVENKLGVPAELELDFGDHLATVKLPPNKTVPALQPLPQAPMRHSQRRTTAPDAQPSALLLVDVHKAEALQQLLPDLAHCIVTPELFTAVRLIDRSKGVPVACEAVRTRALPVRQAKELAWQECLVVALPPGIDNRSQVELEFELWDFAADGGAGKLLAKTRKTLDMGDWAEGSVHQDSVPLPATGQGQSQGACLEVAFSYLLQYHREGHAPTDAWSAEASTAGQRALRIEADNRWALIPSDGLQRGVASSRAMLKNKLPNLQQQASPVASVLAVRLGSEGVALESSFQEGVKRETLRALCQVVNTTELRLEVALAEVADPEWQVLPRGASLAGRSLSLTGGPRSATSSASDLARTSTSTPRSEVVEEEAFENERYIPLRGWDAYSGPMLLPTDRRRFTKREGSQSSSQFPEVNLPEGWEWEGPWEVEKSGHVDSEGWSYAADFGSLKYPPKPGSEKKSTFDFCRRRRWVRRRRQIASSLLQARRSTSFRSDSIPRCADPNVERTVLGTIDPGESIPLPYGWRSSGKQVQLRPVLDAHNDNTHCWSMGASDGDYSLRLDQVDEGLTRLLACPPTEDAAAKGKEAVSADITQQGCGLAAELVTSPVWLSLIVEGDPFPGDQGYEPLIDWKILVAAPLILENQLPMRGSYLVWESPKEGNNLILRQSGVVASGQRAHIYAADTRRTVSLQFYPDGYEWVEPEPLPISLGFSSHKAGIQGKQQLPEKFRAQRSGGYEPPQEIFVDREIDLDAWTLADKKLDPGAAVALGCPLLVRMFVPLWVVNATTLPIFAAVVPIQAPARAGPDSSTHGALVNPSESIGVQVIDTDSPPGQQREALPGARPVMAGSVAIMAYPVQSMQAYKAQDKQLHWGLRLKVGESGWTPPLPLESSGVGQQSESFNTKPVLIRARVRTWGTLHEVVARLDMAGGNFERTLALRLEPHIVISNCTGIPLQLMQYRSDYVTETLSEKARGVQPASGTGLPRATGQQGQPPGLKSVSSDPSVDWTSCMDLPAGAVGLPLHWSLKTDRRALCLRFAPETPSQAAAPWSHPVEADFPNGTDRYVAIPVLPPPEASAAQPSSGASDTAPGQRQTAGASTSGAGLGAITGKDQAAVAAGQQQVRGVECAPRMYLRKVTTMLTATGPSWELHGPRVARRVKHLARSSSGSGGRGPAAMQEVEVVILRFSVELRSSGCVHLVMENVSAKPPYLLENRTANLLQYRQAHVPEDPFQALPPYSAAGFAWQVIDRGVRREVELRDACSPRAPSRTYRLDPVDPRCVTDDVSNHAPVAGIAGLLPPLPLTVPPGECIVQVVDREQEMMDAAGLRSIGGGAAVGRGGLDRVLRISPGRKSGSSQSGSFIAAFAAGDDKSGRALYIVVTLANLEVSMVDQRPEELLAAYMAGARCEAAKGIGPEGNFNSLRLAVASIQVDDQLFLSRFPVVLAPIQLDTSADSDSLVHLTMVSEPLPRGQVYYPYISFRVSRTLQVAVSESFLWRVVEMVERLDLAALSSQPNGQAHAATDTPVQISLVAVSDLSAVVSFRGDVASRPRWAGRVLSWGLNMANFEAVPVKLNGFEMENVAMLWSMFIGQIVRMIQGQLMGVALSFLRNFGIFSGTSGVLGALSAGMASVAMDEEYASERSAQRQERTISSVGDGLMEGGEALGLGFYRGFTGLLSKPVEGAKQTGIQGFFKGVGKGIVGAAAQPLSGTLDFMSSAFEGIDATKDKLLGLERRGLLMKRRRLPRAIGGDRKLQPFVRSDGTERQTRVEEAGQALLRRARESSGSGLVPLAQRSKRSRFTADAYEEHLILPDDHVALLTNRCILVLIAPGFANIHAAVEMGQAVTSVADIPAAQVKWGVAWEDLLHLELRRSHRDLPYADHLIVHRKGSPGQEEEEPLARRIRCYPNVAQAEQLKLVALKVRDKYLVSPQRATRWWARRLAAGEAAPADLPPQERPPTMIAMDYKLAWHTEAREEGTVSIWHPVPPPGYKPLGDVATLGFDPPGHPVQVYRDDWAQRKNGQRPATGPPAEYRLIWRDNGRTPVTFWEPVPHPGYCALGTVVVGGPEQPSLEEVVCVRQDLTKPTAAFDSPIWAFDPGYMQGGLNLQRQRSYSPEGTRVSLWQVDNPAGTFIAVRGLQKPSPYAALTITL
ncbi:hypothetical protein WJX72_004515 [[Myrmecia] bisecta]|uniref:Peroxin/Ferlin domain-containing protein n=1 Tax=[Myrmecia] bisecta TaxID=41462 RepID=A0AAW1QF41_9CHLO